MLSSIPDLEREMRDLLNAIGSGWMSNTAYDTAWIARLADRDPALSYQAIDWLAEHQLPDGSWGAREVLYYHDRVICTLAAVVALARYGRRAKDRLRWQRGLAALEGLTRSATKGLMADIGGATIGFEMIVPTLLAEAEGLGIMPNYKDRSLGRLVEQRTRKLSFLHGLAINRQAPLAYSAEMAGPDALTLLDIDNLQEQNGSISISPAATAYYANYVRPGDPAALAYLRQVTCEGGAPNTAPIDVFERAWVLWNLGLAGALDPRQTEHWEGHVAHLARAWRPGRGAGYSVHGSVVESDDTSVVFEVLARLGRAPDLQTLLDYEEADHFRCLAYELNPSMSANVHVLSALRSAGLEPRHPSVLKILNFLRRQLGSKPYWTDKWHASPYYTTAHAIIACAGYADDLVRSGVEWILDTQGLDGSWGYYMATAEETAYCLQALSLWSRSHPEIDRGPLRRGAAWLGAQAGEPQPALWIGKCLYNPRLVVQAAILSALRLTDGL